MRRCKQNAKWSNFEFKGEVGMSGALSHNSYHDNTKNNSYPDTPKNNSYNDNSNKRIPHNPYHANPKVNPTNSMNPMNSINAVTQQTP